MEKQQQQQQQHLLDDKHYICLNKEQKMFSDDPSDSYRPYEDKYVKRVTF